MQCILPNIHAKRRKKEASNEETGNGEKKEEIIPK
jgi:hypothetical protein